MGPLRSTSRRSAGAVHREFATSLAGMTKAGALFHLAISAAQVALGGVFERRLDHVRQSIDLGHSAWRCLGESVRHRSAQTATAGSAGSARGARTWSLFAPFVQGASRLQSVKRQSPNATEALLQAMWRPSGAKGNAMKSRDLTAEPANPATCRFLGLQGSSFEGRYHVAAQNVKECAHSRFQNPRHRFRTGDCIPMCMQKFPMRPCTGSSQRTVAHPKSGRRESSFHHIGCRAGPMRYLSPAHT